MDHLRARKVKFEFNFIPMWQMQLRRATYDTIRRRV